MISELQSLAKDKEGRTMMDDGRVKYNIMNVACGNIASILL